jgi:starvation-inducible DNA-binding protein
MVRNPTRITINPTLQVFNQTNVGPDGVASNQVVEILNTVLADESVLTMKTRSAHWHANGPGFMDLRNLFDQQFNQLNMIINHIAVRVRMLGDFAIGTFEEFLTYTRLEEQPGEVPDFMDLLADHEACVHFLSEDAKKCFAEYGDHDTYALLMRFARLHEKMAGSLRSFIEPELPRDPTPRSQTPFTQR